MHNSLWAKIGGLSLAGLLAVAVSVWACTTPVYRYAIYNWPAAPYGLFYLYQHEPDSSDIPAHTAIAQASDSPPANVRLIKVDASKQDLFDRLPLPVRKAWEDRPRKDGPLHVLLNPDGAVLFAGRMPADDVPGLVDSPLREKLREALGKGQVVLLTLKSKDAQKNRRAQQLIKKTIADVESGEIALPAAAPDDPMQAPDPNAAPDRMSIASLAVGRDMPKERWLVRLLMAVEPGLDEFVEEPMVFPVYGRGRALPPCIGKGISLENLTEAIFFMAGPCSCMIKDQNPGVDLLFRCDWDAVAEEMATTEPEAPSGPDVYWEVTPLAISGRNASSDLSSPRREPGDGPPKPKKTSATLSSSSLTADAVERSATHTAAATALAQARPEQASPGRKPGDEIPEPTQPPAAQTPLTTTTSAPYLASHLKLYGVAVVAVGLLVVTFGSFWMLRRQSNR